MKMEDIEVLTRTKEALEKHLPENERALYHELSIVLGRIMASKRKERRYYQDNAEKYRSQVREWKQKNPEKQKRYDNEYQSRKRKRKSK